MLENKKVMAKNILRYMNLKNKSRQDVCKDLNFSYSTFSEWVSGKKYPRIDKIEIMANYFGCEKSDLIEEKKEQPTESELSTTKREFIQKVQNMTDAQIERLEQILALVEKTDL
jgi:transcriptional regulator with XRE-family HTH domain